MRRCSKCLLPFFAALLLCACVKGDWTAVVSFCEHTKTAQYPALQLTDCLLTETKGEKQFYWELENGVSLRLICNEEGAVAQCRLLLQRLNADGTAMPVTEERARVFCARAEQVCAALSEISPEQTEKLFRSLRLRETKAYAERGESDLFREGGFTARLVNQNAETVLEISNRWLFPQGEKETPESVPAFDETTNIRTETVPLK